MTHTRTACLAFATLTLLAACQETAQAPVSPADMVLTGGRIYTADVENPWAEAVAISDGRFAFVGTDRGAERYIAPSTVVHDLLGRLVIPGITDSHTHPGLTAILGGDEEAPIPKTSLEDIQDWLAGFLESNDDLIVFACCWPNELFGLEGPRREWLDEITTTRVVTLFDESGHSQWMNSAFFSVFGITAQTPDPAPGLSVFVRDPDGEPTGWVKEFAAVDIGGDLLLPEDDELERELVRFIELLADDGVTTLMDGGNLRFHDKVYGMLARLESEGRLPLRYEGSYHIYTPGQIDNAIDEVNRFRREYGSERLTFNTVKIHFDGVLEIRTAGMLEPFADDPENSGATLLTAERVTELLLAMQGQGMNLHLHTVGDRATRTALDAVEAAQEALGGALDSRVTVSHIEVLADSDVSRFQELGVVANFTPHWQGEYGKTEPASDGPLGPTRAAVKHRAKALHDAGAVVTYSSDVIDLSELDRVSPFFGMQVGHNRQEPALGIDAPIPPPEDQRLPIEMLLQGYTLNGAYQLGRDDQLGSIESGKVADLVVLDRNLFEIDPYEIAETVADAVVMEGEIVRGGLEP